MECDRVREEFVERLTGTLDPERSNAIDEHLAGCAACRAETDRMCEMWNELGTLRPPAASGAAGRISHLIEARGRGAASSTGRRVPGPWIAVSTAALAASLVLGVAIGRRSAMPSREVTQVVPNAQPTTPKDRYVLLLHGPARTPPAGRP